MKFIYDLLDDCRGRGPELADVLDETFADLKMSLLVANRLDKVLKLVLVLHVPADVLLVLKFLLHCLLPILVGVNYLLVLHLALWGHVPI